METPKLSSLSLGGLLTFFRLTVGGLENGFPLFLMREEDVGGLVWRRWEKGMWSPKSAWLLGSRRAFFMIRFRCFLQFFKNSWKDAVIVPSRLVLYETLYLLTERTEGQMLHQWLTSLYSAPYFHVFHSGAGQPRDLPILSSTSFRRQPIWICYVPTHTDKTNVSGHFSFISSSSLIFPLSPILPFFLTPCLCFRLFRDLAVSLLS